ncbi:MAG: M23 family metallopeptidase [Saccharolobus sp.]|uniref:M23 family metallopeptidase n=1 Tax=Saccharolobus TaxID=2100760 RepID=UPI001F10BC30|nr:M23 family metallopeptidase [Saccharolobus shibatae]MCH4816007.1 M23 family metallopeptidase [Saccharolobus shibatae]
MFVKDGSLISYFSSGFPSHVRVKAIDMSSPDLKLFYSPVKGEIVDVVRFEIGRPNRFSSTNYDYMILIENENRKRIKILHVLPWVEKGEYVKEGQIIGEFLQTPYTGGDFPHAHIEGITIRFPTISTYRDSKIGIVYKKDKEFFDVIIKDFAEAGKLRGLGCCGGLLNASLPYACYGGIIGGFTGQLSLYGLNLGYLAVKRRTYLLFEGKKNLLRNWEEDASFKVLANKPICGFAFMEVVLSYNGYPMIRFFLNNINVNEGDEIDISEFIRNRLGSKIY